MFRRRSPGYYYMSEAAVNQTPSLSQSSRLPTLPLIFAKMVVTLLERLEEHVNVDCDTLDTAYIQRMPIVFHDQTSNPKVVHTAITAMENRDILEAAVKELQGQPWDVVYITCVSFCFEDSINSRGSYAS